MTALKTILTIFAISLSLQAAAQVENAGGVRKRSEKEKKESAETRIAISDRLTRQLHEESAHDADLKYQREIYRRLDLSKGTNGALYYPEDVIDGKENLFRIMMRLVADGTIPAYEYLDGREIFTSAYRVNVGETLGRFGITASEAKGSTERNPKFTIGENDMPASQVKDYYIIEKWEFDNRSNRMKTRVDAICPVLSQYGDFGGEVRYPMFWIKMADLRPYLADHLIFLSDDNSLPRYSLDDFFSLGLYEGEIYKTRNMRNLSLAQMFPDEDDRRRAADSIDKRLRSYGKDLWVPSREEYLAMKEKERLLSEAAAKGDTIPERVTVSLKDEKPAMSSRAAKSKKSAARKKAPSKVKSSSGSSSRSAAKSVRRRKK